ncbi:uncharacterized protein [Musca autumnalis]|uniref:uncharacterized protein n=1 Tax=Musca autumnalis TaxID=221902 RepID=UPI003CF57EE0
MANSSYWIISIGVFYFCLYTYFGLHDFINLYHRYEKFNEDTDAKEVTNISADLYYYAVASLFSLVMIVSSIMLIVGAKKGSHSFFTPWLVCSSLNALYNIALEYFFETPEGRSELYMMATIFIFAVWYPVYHQYKKLSVAKLNHRINKTSMTRSGNTMGSTATSKNRSAIDPV